MDNNIVSVAVDYQVALRRINVSLPLELVEELLDLMSQLKDTAKVRQTDDGRYSVLDFIGNVVEKSSARKVWQRVQVDYPEVTNSSHLVQFSGQRQRLTPVANTETLFLIFALLRCNKKGIKQQKPVSGYIYILKDAGNNALKVGFSADIKKRLAQHKSSHPFLELVHSFGVQSIATEQALHQSLKQYKIKGASEWYKNSPKVMPLILAFSSANSELEDLAKTI